MGVIIRPDDLKSIMAGVYARLEALERTDSAWLTSVMAPFTPVSFGVTSVSTGGVGTWANVSGSSAGFSLTARPAKVLVIADLNAGLSAGTVAAYARVAIDGAYAGGAQPVFSGANNTPAAVIALSGVLAIGSHTATIQATTAAGVTLGVLGGDTLVFLLGA